MWLSYQLGLKNIAEVSQPISIDLSDVFVLLVTARAVLGLAIAGLTEFIALKLSLSFLCRWLSEDPKTFKESLKKEESTKKNFIDLTSKFVVYCLLGFNVVVVVPIIFNYFNIQRDSFFFEL